LAWVVVLMGVVIGVIVVAAVVVDVSDEFNMVVVMGSMGVAVIILVDSGHNGGGGSGWLGPSGRTAAVAAAMNTVVGEGRAAAKAAGQRLQWWRRAI
jgi:hypothetical protein